MRASASIILTLLCLSVPFISFAKTPPQLSTEDNALLERIQKEAFGYFWHTANPHTGLVPDTSSRGSSCSIAAVGYGLASLCVADSRGWVTREEAYKRVLTTLKSFRKDPGVKGDVAAEGEFGLFFHFIDMETGKWYKNYDCVSTADSAILMTGVLLCMEYYKGTEVEKIADKLFRDAKWNKFMYNNQGEKRPLISMGYIPRGQKGAFTGETGYLGVYRGYTDNSFMIYFLALASPNYSIPDSAWQAAQKTYHWEMYNGKKVIAAEPPGIIFHYNQHIFLDLQYKKDQVADYFNNTLTAVTAQQEFCAGPEGRQPPDLWGMSSCPAQDGSYQGYGGPIGGLHYDGTLVTHGLTGGLSFTPEKALRGLRKLDTNYSNGIWGKYGMVDAFNIRNKWFSPVYLGLDQGPIVLMIENYRTGMVWKYFMRNRYVKNAMEKIGFRGIIEDFEQAAAGEEYSEYDRSLETDERFAAEGNRSLKLDSADGKDINFIVRPKLNDFSAFRSLNIWSRGADALWVTLVDAKGSRFDFLESREADAGSWRRYSFALAAAAGIDLENITSVECLITPSLDTATVNLDDICLTYEKPSLPPAKPAGLSAADLKGNAVCELTFKKPKDACVYDIRYSTEPINVAADYENLPSENRLLASDGKKTESLMLSLPGSGAYYFGVQVIDKLGRRSQTASFGPVAVTVNPPFIDIADFSDQAIDSETGPYYWTSSSSNCVLGLTPNPTDPEKKSLSVAYGPKGSWDHTILNLTSPLDIRPYRYLKLKVYGREKVIAKLLTDAEHQTDINTLQGEKDGQWNELAFDLSRIDSTGMSQYQAMVDKKNINKFLFFTAPGEEISGSAVIGGIRLE